MEDKHEQVKDNDEDIEDEDNVSSESSLAALGDEDGLLASGNEDGACPEEPLTEEEVEELVSELIEIESKAAEAQEALERESLEKVEHEVREELSQTLNGDDLERAVADEMATLKEEWEAVLDELEVESADLLEQLDGAGVDLPNIYKWIESQIPNGCCTEAWKKRTHWAGSQVAGDAVESISNAEKQLQELRPVRRRLGKVLEEGASGYLEKKIAAGDSSEIVTDKTDVNWDSFLKMVSTQTSEENVSFGSKHWASVYLASTPQQAAVLGINFPGVDEVEEIAEIDGNSADPFVADAIANEKELDLSEAQRKNYRKVKEDEDANIDRKLQIRLKQRRNRKRTKQDRSTNDISIDQYVGDNLENPDNADNKDDLLGSCAASTDMFNSESSTVEPIQSKVVKHEREASEDCNEAKRRRTIIPGDDDAIFLNEDDCVPISCHQAGEGDQPVLQENEGDFVGAGSKSEMENLHCTICGELVTEVLRHPLLEVIVCGKCKSVVEAKMSNKDHGSSLCYCAWCGRSSDLINCKSCKMLFCIPCINRHLGKEYLLEIKSSGWKCCKCSPSILRRLILEFRKATGSTDLTIASSGSGSDDSDDSDDSNARPDVSISSSVRHKKIRRIIDDTELGEETKKKIAIEKERQQRLKSLQAQFSSKTMEMNAMASTGILPEGASSEVLGDVSTGFIVNVVREKGEDAVRIPSSLSAKLKVHQIAGIRFMWENIIQSIRKVRAGDKGLGCILAHTMGLGKTFQVIAFLYTAMRVIDLGLRCALIVTPVNVLHNWRQEFAKWAPSEYKPLRVYMLDDVPRERRAELLRKWKRKGGVFLIGYTAFRNLSLGKNAKDYEIAKQVSSALKEGPDILVCDEAHMIKNNGAEITQALKQVQCQRRIALTGSPLQNNLMEYYCMVDFVREGFLGSSHEFRNRFQNPIENGQHTNSTADDVKIMNQRSHILYEQLKGFVQRMDMSVVKKDLPPKTVFVVAVKLSQLQRKLYKKFLDVHGFTKNKDAIEGMRRRNMFAGYQALAQVWNHPWILKLMKERGYAKREVVESFLPEDGSSDENMDYNVGTGEKSKTTNASLQKNATSYMLEGWWNDLLNVNNYREADYSGKMVLLLDILTMASDMGDKALVFSQSISTLDLIEFYLTKLPQRGKVGKCWKRGKDWYRIDGKTEGYERQRLVEMFNDPRNKRVKCTLISTKAGSLGINLYAANRVIIVDGSWNPTYDLQAIYRAWRYGQKKPVYAYRLMAHGTMEEKIYKRQVTKEGLAARVVDRQQVYRTISKEEMLHLFAFGDDENIDTLSKQNGHVTDTISENVGNLLKQKSAASGSCSDKLMEKLLSRHCPRWIANYHEHETLLQENEDEKLTKEEQDMAWEVYRRSMEWEEVQRAPVKSSLDGQNINPGTTPQPQPKPSSVDPPAVQENRSASIPQEQVKKIPPIPLSRLRFRTMQRQCTTTAHMLTLRCQGTKPGCTTFCGECGKEIRWEDLTGKSSR